MSKFSRLSCQKTNRRSMTFEQCEKRELLTTTLTISEINYAPYEPSAAYGDTSTVASDYEFLEILNYGDAPVSLEGIKLVKADVGNGLEGVEFAFKPNLLGPGKRILVAEKVLAFQSRYGKDLRLAGQWSGGLGGSETLTLQDRDGTIIQQFAYDSNSGWPTRPDGLGSTLELKVGGSDPSDQKSWSSSDQFGGTPGTDRAKVDAQVIVNEVLAHTDLPQVDTIELYNTTNAAVNISNWYMTDAIADISRFYALPGGTRVGPNGYLTIDESDFNVNGKGFALSELGDRIWLISADSTGRPLAFHSDVKFDATVNGQAIGRIPSGDPKSDLLPLSQSSFGSANGAHLVGDVVVSEVHYNPADGDLLKEFIELRNTTSAPIELKDWSITDAVNITIPKNTMLGTDEAVVLVPFDPGNSVATDSFRTAHGIGGEVQLIGPWTGKLSNGGESVTLMMPLIDAGKTVYAIADQVDYNDKAPWPTAADGMGSSINRYELNLFGNDAASWQAAVPTPGDKSKPVQVVGDVNHDGIFNSSDFVLLFQIGEYEDEIDGNSTYDEGDWNGDGDFTSADFVVAFQAGTYVAASRPASTESIAAALADDVFEDSKDRKKTAIV